MATLLAIWSTLKSSAPWVVVVWGAWKACDAALTRYATQNPHFREKWAGRVQTEIGQPPTESFWREIDRIDSRHILRSSIWSAILLSGGIAWLFWGQ